MGYDINTKTLSRPLNTENIRACLGENSLSIKNLACSPLINPKSKFKPMRYPKPVEGGESEYKYFPPLDELKQKEVNYGIEVNSYSLDGEGGSKLITTMAGEIANALNLTDTNKEVKKAFYYDRLTAEQANDIGRISDFFGYNHLAGDWFTITFVLKGVVGQENSCQLRLNWGEVLTGFGDLQAWGAYQGLWNTATGMWNAVFGLIMKPKGGTWNGDSKFYCILDQEGINQQDEQLIEFTPVSGSAGEWEVYPVMAGGGLNVQANSITSMADIGSVGKFVPLPYSAFTEWTVKSSGNNESGDVIDLFYLTEYLDVTTSAEGMILDAGVVSINGVTATIEVLNTPVLNGQERTDITFTVDSMVVSSDTQGETEMLGASSGLAVATGVIGGNMLTASKIVKEGDNGVQVRYEENIYLTIYMSDSFGKTYKVTEIIDFNK